MTAPLVGFDDELSSLSRSDVEAHGCIQPLRLDWLPADDAGAPKTFTKACGSRLVSECPSCAALYRGDAAKQLRLGIFEVPPAPIVWMTLTTRTPGAIHVVPRSLSDAVRAREGTAKGRRCRCGVEHSERDARFVGVPVDMRTYDYVKAVRQNAHIGTLLSRTYKYAQRALDLRRLPRASVVEFQRNGSAHVHAMIRWEHDFDPVDPLRSIAAEVSVRDAVSGDVYKWGPQLDLQVMDLGTADGPTQAARVSGYLGKTLNYSVKDLGSTPGDGGRPSLSLPQRIHYDRLSEAARAQGDFNSKQKRQFGVGAQTFRTAGGWTPNGEGFQTLRQARRDYARSESAPELGAVGPSDSGVWRVGRLQRAVTVADVISQRTRGYSSQDYREVP